MEMIAKMTDAEMIVEIITVKMDRIVAAIVEMATVVVIVEMVKIAETTEEIITAEMVRTGNRGNDRRDGGFRGNDRRDNNRRDGQNGNRGNDRRDGGFRGNDRRDNNNRRDGQNNNRGNNRNGFGGGRSAQPMDTMKPEVKQSRQQRANKDSRSAKQRYGKERNRDDYEDDMFQNKNARKKKDPNRKGGAFIAGAGCKAWSRKMESERSHCRRR